MRSFLYHPAGKEKIKNRNVLELGWKLGKLSLRIASKEYEIKH
jgi:hypothetical protein